MIITLVILFFNWSKSRIIKVESLNFEFIKSISLTKSSYIPNQKINKTIAIINKSIEDMILKRTSLFSVIEESISGLKNIIASIISQLPRIIRYIEEIIESITASNVT